ncbi:MAG: methyltransferase domain-containing protein [Gemmatales bacterium]|nr:methyltransferase domain-containing protein [Gemmatales bacterium]
MLRSWFRFLAEWWRDFYHTGAIAPSSPFLARAMTQVLKPPRPAWRILEVGPGTGSVTAAILRQLQPGDRFDLVEINPRFVEWLQVRFASDPRFQPYVPQVYLYPTAVEEFRPEERYDCIISGLPLNNFRSEQVRTILELFERWLQPQGWLVYFEYVGIRRLKMPFVGKSEKRRLYRVGRITQRFLHKHRTQRQLVLANVPPAFVYQVRMNCPLDDLPNPSVIPSALR